MKLFTVWEGVSPRLFGVIKHRAIKRGVTALAVLSEGDRDRKGERGKVFSRRGKNGKLVYCVSVFLWVQISERLFPIPSLLYLSSSTYVSVISTILSVALSKYPFLSLSLLWDSTQAYRKNTQSLTIIKTTSKGFKTNKNIIKGYFQQMTLEMLLELCHPKIKKEKKSIKQNTERRQK